MDHAVERVADKVQTLSDLELAALLCLVAEQHAIIEAHSSQLDALTQELQLVSPAQFCLRALNTYAESDRRQCLWPLQHSPGVLREDHLGRFRQWPSC